MKMLKPMLLLGVLFSFTQQAFADEWIYSFRPGDTLWDLCEKYIAEPNCWKKVADRNKIAKPRNIKPGTRLFLPIAWLKVLPVSAKVLTTRGEVTIKRSGVDAQVPLQSNTEIFVGDEIVTNEGSATLQFADESILIVTPGSEVVFDTLSLYGESGMVDTRVRLNRGRARAKVKPVKGPASRYEILTPAAVAAVRGTEFRVVSEATDPPQMRAEVLEGKVAVGNDAGEQNVAQGFALKAVSGETPQAPVKMLAAPMFETELPETITVFPWSIRWAPVDGAQAYRLQVYERGLLFDDLLEETKLADTKFALNKMEEGRYDIRVRAIDAHGFEGQEAVYTLMVEEPKEIEPLTVSAALKKQQQQKSIHWQWPEAAGADSYLLHFEVETAQDGQKHKRLTVTDNEFKQGIKHPGIYRLKVAPVVGEQTLAFSEPEVIRVRNDSEAPLWVQVIVGATLLFIIF